MTIKVAIVEDIDGIRDGLSTLINGSDGFRCVSAHPNAEAALASFSAVKPDVVLMDINLPNMSGIQCVRKLKAISPSTQIIMHTVYEDAENIFESLQAGASGYLLKRTPPAKLLEAIMEVHAGGSPMSSTIARKVVQTFHQQGRSKSEQENLTPREEEILAELAKGFRYKEIADNLFIGVETVRSHIHKIYEKLHVRSRTEAVVKYLQK
ncbi:MAG: response regulator transcription factor [Bacteroidetes bacterium]|nr:response regulator transcription factor [Bacteroidota bacterium]MCW5897603.1 response regulator transcription factor [Bacteroidota bacterium]